MSKNFKSFEDLGQAVREHGQRKVGEIFEESVRDDFDSIPEGPFKSSLPEINWISFACPIVDRKTGDRSKDSMNVTIFSKTNSGRDAHHTWLLNRNGTIKHIQPIPPELSSKYSQEEISYEIVSLLERIGPSFIHLTDMDIIPAQDKGVEREDSADGDSGGSEKPIDPERLKFFRSLKDAKFISANRSNGMKGYVVVFFDNRGFLIVENEYKGNAAFIVDLPEAVDMDAIREELSVKKSEAGRGGEISKEELRDEVERRYWQPISEKAKTRSELRALGAERIIHTPDTWQETMLKVVESRK